MNKMIEIRGKNVSEDTIVEALKAHIGFEEEYQFKAGDVVLLSNAVKRIIVYYDGRLLAFNKDGCYVANGQKNFEEQGYKKIGELKDLLK